MPTPRESVTALLIRWRNGDQSALEELFPIVYEEMHHLAHLYMRGERAGHTLQTSALVNEAYIRLVDHKGINWQNRNHFMGVAARAMRRVLVDHARHFLTVKHVEKLDRVDLEAAASLISSERSPESRAVQLIAVHEALEKLAEIDERKCRVVELRYILELTAKETAEVLDISESSVTRDWDLAKAWLFRELPRRAGQDVQASAQIERHLKEYDKADSQ